MTENPFKVGQLWKWRDSDLVEKVHQVKFYVAGPGKTPEWRAYGSDGFVIFTNLHVESLQIILLVDVEDPQSGTSRVSTSNPHRDSSSEGQYSHSVSLVQDSEEEAQEEIPFADQVWSVLDRIGNLLIEKNKSYGDAALNPIRIFSKADTLEQLRVRIDDKLNRLAKGHEYPSEDTVDDLLGYLVLYKIGERNG